MNATQKKKFAANKPIQQLVKHLDLNTRGIAKNFSAGAHATNVEAQNILADLCGTLVLERSELRAAMENKLKEQKKK